METDTTTTAYRPLEQWSPDELISLEDELWSGWTARDIDELDFDDMLAGDPEDRYGAAPAYGDWLEYHLRELDRILNAAGYPKLPSDSTHRGWMRSPRMRVIKGDAS